VWASVILDRGDIRRLAGVIPMSFIVLNILSALVYLLVAGVPLAILLTVLWALLSGAIRGSK
jgi:hypothetical protein